MIWVLSWYWVRVGILTVGADMSLTLLPALVTLPPMAALSSLSMRALFSYSVQLCLVVVSRRLYLFWRRTEWDGLGKEAGGRGLRGVEEGELWSGCIVWEESYFNEKGKKKGRLYWQVNGSMPVNCGAMDHDRNLGKVVKIGSPGTPEDCRSITCFRSGPCYMTTLTIS